MKFPPSHNLSRRSAAVFRALFILLALAALFYVVAPRALHRALMATAKPLSAAGERVGATVQNVFALFGDTIELRREYERATRELSEARAALAGTDAYRRENEELKKILGRPDAAKRIPAAILAKPSRSLYDTLIVDVGERALVHAGDVVVVGDFALGTIREVYPEHAKAVLFSTAGETTRVSLGGGIHTEARGRGGGNFIVELPKEVVVGVGEWVTRAESPQSPLGVVAHIETTETSSFQKVFFTLPVNIHTVDRVDIIRL